LLFVFLDFIFRFEFSLRRRFAVVGLLGVAGLTAAAYLFPYFATEMSKVVSFKYFGIEETRYLHGLIPELFSWVDLPLSWTTLIAAKSAYFVGLRPSHAGIATPWLVLRSAAGLILLPGLVYGLFFASRRQRLFIWVFVFPIFLSSTQDRYNLAIQPLLFYFGILAYQDIWSRIRTSRPITARPDSRT
jgi:hypothetical protein